MQLSPPLSTYLTGAKPSHSTTTKLATHMNFLSEAQVRSLLTASGYLSSTGKITKKAVEAGLIDTCEKKPLWHVKRTTKTLLQLSRATVKKPSKPAVAIVPQAPTRAKTVWTDLENIGTYFGVGKNKIGTWLDAIGLRDYKPRQVNESGDLDMLDIANESKEKFRAKIPTELALAQGYAQVEVIEYKKKGKDQSFEKYSWHLEKVKAVLVKAGHELDTERKLLKKGKGKNSDVVVSSIDEKVEKVYQEWRKQYLNPSTQASSWKVFDKQPTAVLMRVEMKLGYPRFLKDRLYLDKANLSKISV